MNIGGGADGKTGVSALDQFIQLLMTEKLNKPDAPAVPAKM
jgi:hypothetical protein